MVIGYCTTAVFGHIAAAFKGHGHTTTSSIESCRNEPVLYRFVYCVLYVCVISSENALSEPIELFMLHDSLQQQQSLLALCHAILLAANALFVCICCVPMVAEKKVLQASRGPQAIQEVISIS